MKESEAKKKWCPMFNNSSINERGGSTNNRKSFNTQTFSSDCMCIGSVCMMWEAEQVPESVKKEVEKKINYADYKEHHYDGFRFSRVLSIATDKPEVEGNAVIELTRYVDTDSGDCSLKPKELYCEGCNQ